MSSLKLTEILSCCLFVKNFSFLSYSIFNLLLPSFPAWAARSRGDSLYILPQTIFPCQAFFRTFFIFFKYFFRAFSLNFFKTLFQAPSRQLVYLTTLFFNCQLFFSPFYYFFAFFIVFYTYKKHYFCFLLKVGICKRKSSKNICVHSAVLR